MKSSYLLDLNPVLRLSDEQYYTLCQANSDLKLEQTANGELIILAPTGGESGNRNAEITYQVQAWTRQNNSGLAFDSSTEFKLSTGAYYSPDTSWVTHEQWDRLTAEQKRKFPPLTPDFVIELRSETDSLKQLRSKMQDYINAGVRLAWFIDPQTRSVEIYRPNQDVEILQDSTSLSGETVLPGFRLDLEPVFRNL